MASDNGGPAGFSKPPLKRGLKKPPGAETRTEPPAETSHATFSPLDAKQAFNSPPSLVLPRLYLGSQFNAASKKQLAQLQITKILDLKDRHVSTDVANITVLAVPMSDLGDTIIVDVLNECFEFIDQARESQENILVHCRGGVNRSATIVLAYLMKREKMTLKQAWDHLRERRPTVQPVVDYMKQLRKFEEVLYGFTTLELQEIGTPISLTQRISEWREMKRKIGSMPADLASSRSTDDLSEEYLDTAARSNTSPIVKPRMACHLSDLDESGGSSSSSNAPIANT